MAILAASPLEQEQLVTARPRRYVVTEVANGTLPEGLFRVSDTRAQHVMTLPSGEDDGLAENSSTMTPIQSQSIALIFPREYCGQ